MESNLMVRVNERQYGPLSKTELRTLVRKGKFSLNDYVWMEKEEDWIKAENLEQIQKLFHSDDVAETDRKIIAVGSGKGGVGKTVLSASLGIGLAAMGREVILVDADFGGANLHTCMGILEPKYTFLDYYTMNRETLEDIILDSPIENLKLISGACGTLGMANPKYSQKQRLIHELRELPADDIILDLGAGTSYNVIDFFLSVDEKIVVTTPEPMAIQEAFDFIKLCLLRKVQQTFKNDPEILSILEIEGDSSLIQFNSPVEEILNKAKNSSKEIGQRIEEVLNDFQPRLILNMVMEPDEIKEGMAIKTAVAELLSINLEYTGYVDYDDNMRKSVKELKPYILQNPNSAAAQSIAKIITLKMFKKHKVGAFLKNWQMRKKIQSQLKNYPQKMKSQNEIICSVKCFYWDECEFQNGGMPCRVRHLEPVFKM
jgi:flagellar biosynthesis protein FlhG